MYTEVIYETPKGKTYITGNNKVFIAGSKKGNLLKSLKHCNYLFLLKECQNN